MLAEIRVCVVVGGGGGVWERWHAGEGCLSVMDFILVVPLGDCMALEYLLTLLCLGSRKQKSEAGFCSALLLTLL